MNRHKPQTINRVCWFSLAGFQAAMILGFLGGKLIAAMPSHGLFSVFNLPSAGVAVATNAPVGTIALATDSLEVNGVTLLTSVVGFVLLALFLSYGLMAHKAWAWSSTMVVQLVGSLVSMMGILDGRALWVNGLRLAIAALVATYLMQPQVRRLFRIQ